MPSLFSKMGSEESEEAHPHVRGHGWERDGKRISHGFSDSLSVSLEAPFCSDRSAQTQWLFSASPASAEAPSCFSRRVNADSGHGHRCGS